MTQQPIVMIKLKIAITTSLYLFLHTALAQTPPPDQTHSSDQLTLSLLTDQVLESYPVYEELLARLAEAEKFGDKANSLFADALNIQLRYQTGKIGNNDNLQEYEAGVELPLWRFGERSASKKVARGIESEANAFASLVRWELAGALRTSLWRIALTTDRVNKTKKAAEVSLELLRGITRRVELGNLPRSDLLQAKQDKLNNDIRLSEAQIEHANSIRAYQIITEQSVMPADFTEDQSTRTGISKQHPALLYSTARLERALAENQLAQQSGTSNPALLLGVRSERGGTDLSAEESVGVFFSYPLSFGAHVNSQRAVAELQATTVRAEHRVLRRQLETLYHDAKLNVIGAERAYHLARQKNELAQQHLAMSVTALDIGEMHLLEFLLIKEVAFNAEMESSGNEIRWKNAIAQYNQTVGELP